MKYNSMTIHCASLCLDVLTQRHFFCYTPPDILAFKAEVASQIKVRIETESLGLSDEKGMIDTLTAAVIHVLLYYHVTQSCISADFIMDRIQYRLDESLAY